MATPTVCPHDNQAITTTGPYYRQVHPNNFQNGLALPGSFVLKNTGCHYALSLHDGHRTTPARCFQEYTENNGHSSAAVVEVSPTELTETGVFVVVDSPDGFTYAHVDALYNVPMSRKNRSDAQKTLIIAANKRGPVFVPRTITTDPERHQRVLLHTRGDLTDSQHRMPVPFTR